MKKIISFLSVLLLAISIQAQDFSIQRKFLGLELARSYSYEQIRTHFRDTYSRSAYEVSRDINSTSYGIDNIAFAGEQWNTMLYMLNDAGKSSLMSVVFISTEKTIVDAEKKCDAFNVKFIEKYGEPIKDEDLKEGMVHSYSWQDNKSKIVSATLRIDNNYYYLITYYDLKQKQRYAELLTNEL